MAAVATASCDSTAADLQGTVAARPQCAARSAWYDADHSPASGDSRMKVNCMLIRSATRSWKSLCEEAAEFATKVGRDRLINISVSAAGDNLGAEGTIFD